MTDKETVTIRDVYELVEKLREELNGRLRSLESSRAWMRGAIAVITAIVVPVAVTVIIMAVTGLFR